MFDIYYSPQRKNMGKNWQTFFSSFSKHLLRFSEKKKKVVQYFFFGGYI